jgi:hypothetical protein
VDREVDEFAGGVLGGEAALGLDRLAELAIQRFDRVCCTDNVTRFRLEGEERVMYSQLLRQDWPISGICPRCTTSTTKGPGRFARRGSSRPFSWRVVGPRLVSDGDAHRRP